ncbi:MAG: helix-turn-helix domain-containing protein [Chitinophagaceae bacterium]|nr:helix-turn-helix domain-containing protein [Chitinophagaceae bacterium]
MSVQIFSPSPQLAAFIAHYYYINEAASSPLLKKKIPDGSIELHIHFGDPFHIMKQENGLISHRSFIQGPLTSFIEIQPGKRTEFIGVKFKPDGFYRFVNGNIKGFANQVIDIRDIWTTHTHLLENEIFSIDDMPGRIAIIEKFLSAHLGNSNESRIDYCIENILQKKGITTVKELAGLTCLSPRQLERNFIERTGLSPGYFSRIQKMQFVLQDIEKGKYGNLTDLCYQYEYYDQSHFIKEVANFTGINPGKIEYSPSCNAQTDYL